MDKNKMFFQIPYLDGEFAAEYGAVGARIYKVAAPNYTLFLDNKGAQPRRIIFERDAQFDAGTDMTVTYCIIEKGNQLVADHMEHEEGVQNNTRVIEEGNFVCRFDMLMLRYGENTNYGGTCEVNAYPGYFAINYEVRSLAEAKNITLKYVIKLHNRTVSLTGRNRALAVAPDGNNLIFAAYDAHTTLHAEGDTVTVTRTHVNIAPKRWADAAIAVIPTKRKTFVDIKRVYAFNEKLSVTAHMTSPEEKDCRVSVDRFGSCKVDITSTIRDICSNYDARNTYQKVALTFTNDSDIDVEIPVCFAYGHENTYRTAIPITGLSPMMRRNGVPTGTQVQISKTWDGVANDDLLFDYEYRSKQGYWMRATTSVVLPRHSTQELEYFCAFEHYGGIVAASHAQLGLMGWGHSSTQWDQLALGSHGETICYSVCGGSTMQDIRGLYTRSFHGNMAEYGWAGNVGGGNFLIYFDGNETDTRIAWPKNPAQDISNMISDYRTQCPIMTEAVFSGTTPDGKISAEYNVILSSTDDCARHYHRITLDFNADTEFSRLSLYSRPSNRYMPPCLRNLTVGADETVGRTRVLNKKKGYYDKASFKNLRFPAGKNQWVYQYNADFVPYVPDFVAPADKDAHPGRQANINTLLTLRRIAGKVNGKRLTKMEYSLFGINTWNMNNMGMEIVLPKKFGNVIQKGSHIELIAELTVIPADIGAYYGDTDYIINNADILNTAAIAPFIVKGNDIKLSALKGKITDNYPPSIKCVNEDILAEFTMENGLGYTPVRFTNVRDRVDNLELQVLQQGRFRPVTKEFPTGEDGDDIQVLAVSPKEFEVVYAVKNARYNSGNNTYRLVRK